MQAQLTVKEAARFFIENRGNEFKEWTEDDVVASISEAIANKVFAWSNDSRGQLTGIALGSRSKKEVHLVAIIIKSPASISDFVGKIQSYYPGYTLVGHRRGKKLEFKVDELKEMI